MGILRVIFLITLLLASISTLASSQNFTQCLLSQSLPFHPISNAIFTPQNASFSSVLQAYIRNLRFNTSSTPKPLLIIAAEHESHVSAAVTCAKSHKLQMRIRSGGHDYDGVSYAAQPQTQSQPFFVLDMFRLRSVHVDAEARTAWVKTGAILGEVYYGIWEKSKTLAFPAGVCPSVGVGGHLSGGGYGNMMRKYGLTVDNIVDARMVDVNGKILDRKAMGEDLFWAIRGGGGASFGVILAYKINLVPVPQNVTVFRVSRTLEQNATDIVYRWQEVAPALPDDLFIRLTMDVRNGTVSGGGKKTVRATFLSMFLGDSSRLMSIMNQRFPELGLVRSDCVETSWIQSVLFWTNIAVGTSENVLLERIQNVTYLKRGSDYVKEPIPRDGLEKLWKKMIELETPMLTFNPYGGKMAEIPSEEVPFPHRKGNLWKIQYASNWNDNGLTDLYMNRTRKLFEFMTPYVSSNPREAFFPYRDLNLGINLHESKIKSYVEGKKYGLKYFKGNFDRLVKIKTKVDPDNFFRNEQSIPVFPKGRK